MLKEIYQNQHHHVYIIHYKLGKKYNSRNSIKKIFFRLTQIPSIETQTITHEHCYYCQQQQQQQIALSPLSTPTTTTTTTTLNVVINQQTVEQLIHNSLRKLLYPALM
jgi:hypothetical protein